MQRKDIKFNALLLIFLVMMSIEVPKDWRVVAAALLGLYAAYMLWQTSESLAGKLIASLAPFAMFMLTRLFSAEMSGVLKRNPVEKVGELLGYYARECGDQVMVIAKWGERSADLKIGYAISGAFCVVLFLCFIWKLATTKKPQTRTQ